jgi:hypothetical protein
MKGRFHALSCAGLVCACALQVLAGGVSPQEGADVTIPEAGGEHLRIDTRDGPINLWRPARYDPRTAGIVIYIHGYFTSVDEAWADHQLAEQFRASGRNALFIAIEAPQSSDQEVLWNSLDELLRTVEDLAPFPLPNGPLVVVGHSGAYRTILSWLGDPRVQYVILLDGLYSGQAEFRQWLLPHPDAKPHRLVLVAYDTRPQCRQFARHAYGMARRKMIPTQPASFTAREKHARLLLLRSQYDHDAMVSGGRVIPVLLQISPIKALGAPSPRPARKTSPSPPNRGV